MIAIDNLPYNIRDFTANFNYFYKIVNNKKRAVDKCKLLQLTQGNYKYK